MSKFSFLMFGMLIACGSEDKDATSSDGGCDLGSDCTVDEFCMIDFRDGASSDAGVCMALPDECEGPTTCDDCDLGAVACPESYSAGCSDDMSGAANPIYSCN
jgi:hypothetical protein